jgi:TonB family protein
MERPRGKGPAGIGRDSRALVTSKCIRFCLEFAKRRYDRGPLSNVSVRAAAAVFAILAGCATPGGAQPSGPVPGAVRAGADAPDWEQYCAGAVSNSPPGAAQGRVVQAPRVLREVLARYPLQPCLERREGEVVMRVNVAVDGSVKGVFIMSSAGEDLDLGAVDAIWRFRFSPACSDGGKPVPVAIVYKYRFEWRPDSCSQ